MVISVDTEWFGWFSTLVLGVTLGESGLFSKTWFSFCLRGVLISLLTSIEPSSSLNRGLRLDSRLLWRRSNNCWQNFSPKGFWFKTLLLCWRKHINTHGAWIFGPTGHPTCEGHTTGCDTCSGSASKILFPLITRIWPVGRTLSLPMAFLATRAAMRLSDSHS